MAERIGVIADGRLVAEGTVAELRNRSGDENSTLEEVFLDIVEGNEERSDDASVIGSLAA